jgi:hypothetical protein
MIWLCRGGGHSGHHQCWGSLAVPSGRCSTTSTTHDPSTTGALLLLPPPPSQLRTIGSGESVNDTAYGTSFAAFALPADGSRHDVLVGWSEGGGKIDGDDISCRRCRMFVFFRLVTAPQAKLARRCHLCLRLGIYRMILVMVDAIKTSLHPAPGCGSHVYTRVVAVRGGNNQTPAAIP